MSKYNIVTNEKINNIFKNTCKHYKVFLGYANSMIAKNGEKVANDKDKFAVSYNSFYKTTINSKGRIGDIQVYVDNFIKEDKMAWYWEDEEFVFDLDTKMIREKGIDFYLGHLIKSISDQMDKRKETKKQKEEQKKQGDPMVVINNPGMATYDDMMAYLKMKQSQRLVVPDKKRETPY
jgi:hypothetical protein